jgi:hypothetical protein
MKTAAALLLVLLFPLLAAAGQAATTTTTTTTTAGGAATTTPATTPVPNPATPDLSLPLDTAKQWVVGFSEFDATEVAPENGYLAFSIPLLLKDAVSGLTVHTIADDERGLCEKAVIDGALIAVAQSITAARRERDAILFAGTPPSADALKGTDAKIAALEARRAFLGSLDPSKVSVDQQKPVSFKEGSGAGKLLARPVIPAGAYCARESLDLLVGGSIRQVEGYLLVDVWAWDAARGRVTISTREAAQREELYASVPLWGKDLVATILGRSWAMVVFTPDPPDSSLFVDGALTASGVSPTLYLVPGIRTLTVRAPGYREVTRTLTLLPGDEVPLAISLSKEAAGTIAISSLPAGADMYLNSIWQGRTPLDLERPTERGRGLLSLGGYYDYPLSLGADSPPQIAVTLLPDIGARDVAQKKARDEFYVSFAWFAASIPLPLFANAIAIDYAVLRNDYQYQGQYSQAQQAQVGVQVFQTGFYVGLAVSASLFTWMVFRILHYISVSNGTAG